MSQIQQVCIFIICSWDLNPINVNFFAKDFIDNVCYQKFLLHGTGEVYLMVLNDLGDDINLNGCSFETEFNV